MGAVITCEYCISNVEDHGFAAIIMPQLLSSCNCVSHCRVEKVKPGPDGATHEQITGLLPSSCVGCGSVTEQPIKLQGGAEKG